MTDVPYSYLFSRNLVFAIRQRSIAPIPSWVLERHIPQLVPATKNMVSHSNVDQNREEDTDPNGNVVRIKTNNAPFGPDPAPQLELLSE